MACALIALTGLILTQLGNSVLCVKLNAEGTRLAASGEGGLVVLQDLASKEKQFFHHGAKKSVKSVLFGPEETYLLTGCRSGELSFWDLKTKAKAHEVLIPAGINAMTLTGDKKT